MHWAIFVALWTLQFLFSLIWFWYSVWCKVSSLVHSIACDHKKIFPCSALLDGEYGLSDLCIGVPVVLGKNGIEEIIILELEPADLHHLSESAEGVKKTNSLLNA